MKNTNVLLLAMSTLPKNMERDNYYQYQNEDGSMAVFPAKSQLEPITRMLCDKLAKKGEKLDKIIILETEATRVKTEEKPAAVTFYKERVALFLQKTEYDDILIKEDEPAEGIKKATDSILQEHEKHKQNGDKMMLWIDTQGGFRDVVMVFTAIISLLREQGIEAEGIYSVRFDSENTEEKPCPIIDQTKKYDIFKFVSAMQEFMDFGKATGLKKYYGEENSFVQAIDKIADAIQMCQPLMFEKAVAGLATYMESEKDRIQDSYLSIFIEFIKKDYGILLEKPDDTKEQIEWCVRKEFYQQAITIYIERMPKYYFDRGILELEVDFDQNLDPGKDPYVEAFYTKFFNDMFKKTDEIFTGILSDLLEYKDLNEDRKALKYLDAKLGKIENGLIIKGISRLMDDLKSRYGRDGKLLEKHSENEAGTVESYLRFVCSNKGEHNKYLYGCNPKKDDGYTKKILAIKAAGEIQPQSVKMMEYYLAVKFLRNRMNHANSETGEADERRAIVFLKEDGIDIGIGIKEDEPPFDYQKIKNLIKEGINCSD